jgi:recombination protein RecT
MKNAINVNDTSTTVPAVKAEKKTTIGDLIYSYKDKFASALPEVITPERFARISANAVASNPDLAKCSQTSLIGALLCAAQAGLEPNTALGQAYIIPYKDKARFQISYKGLIELAHRSGQLKDISAHVVYEGDTFEYELGLEPKLKHIPAMTGRGKPTWVYAVYHLISGGYGFEVMSVEDVNKHRAKYSKAKNSPWDSAWEEMAKKTVVKKCLKYAPMASDFVRATNTDEHTADIDLNADFIEPVVDFNEDNIIDTPYTVEEEGKENTDDGNI